MKTVLINPTCKDQWFKFRPEKERYSFYTTGASPPLGLLYLATNLNRNGHDVRLIDNDAERRRKEEILTLLSREDPDVVGFSLLTGSSENAHRVASRVKEELPAIDILYGGPVATSFPREIMEKYEFVDYLLRGEAEFTSLKLFEGLEGRGELDGIEGLAYREGDEVKLNEGVPVVENVEELPHPDRSLLNAEYDLSFPLGSSDVRLSVDKYTSVLTSRGCINDCNFCLSENEGWRARSPEDVVEELEGLYDEGYGHIFFIDNNFAADEERAKEICSLIRERDLDFYWCAQLSAGKCSREVLEEMKKAGCEGILVGMESASERILNYYNKPTDPHVSRRAVENARSSGISVVMGTFIIGAPDETREEARRTIEFARELELDGFVLSKLVLKPGTTLWDEMREKGYLREEKIRGNLEETIEQNEVYSKLSEGELESLIDEAYSNFIRRPSFWAKTFYRTLKSDFRRRWILLNRRGILLYIKEKVKESLGI